MIKKQTLFKALLLGTIITQTGIYAMQAEDTLQTEVSIENAHKQAYTLLNSVLTDLEKESITTLPTFEDINKRLKEITTITKNVVSPDDFHQYSFLNNALRSLLTKRFTDYNDAIKHFDNLRRSQKRPGVQEIKKRLQIFATNYISLVETGRLKEQKTVVIPTVVPAITTQALHTTQRATVTIQQPVSQPVSTQNFTRVHTNATILHETVRQPILYTPPVHQNCNSTYPNVIVIDRQTTSHIPTLQIKNPTAALSTAFIVAIAAMSCFYYKAFTASKSKFNFDQIIATGLVLGSVSALTVISLFES